LVGHFANAAVRYSGLTHLLRRLRLDAPILCYHNVVRDESLGSGDPGTHITVDRFASQMEWLRRRYQVLSLEELFALPTGRSWRGIAAITFDDGYLGALRHAIPVLQALDLPATFFILGHAPTARAGFWWDDTAIVRQANPQRKAHWLTALAGDDSRIRAETGSTSNERPADLLPGTWQDIRSATTYPRLSIGAHSMTHRALPALDPSALTAELVDSRNTIARELNTAPTFFAYPYGAWSNTVHDTARDAGYTAAFTLADCPAKSTDSPWALPRICIPASLTLSGFAAWLVDLRKRP
jgi:peptidoglycan/xylan/chitin deacetylase (PgdA/CDA1 family)